MVHVPFFYTAEQKAAFLEKAEAALYERLMGMQKREELLDQIGKDLHAREAQLKPDLAYSHANEAVRLDASSDAAIVLRRHALYKLMPSKRCIDNAARLCEQAEELKARGELREAYNMFYGAYRWHPSARSLYGIMRVAFTGRADTAYVLASELLALCSGKHLMAEGIQLASLRSLAFPKAEDLKPSVPATENLPASYQPSTWPTNLGIHMVVVMPQHGCARVLKREDGCELLPQVPLEQLADFLNNHVADSVDGWNFASTDSAHVETAFIRLMREVNPERFRRSNTVDFALFFEDMPWRDVQRAFDEVLVGVQSFTFNDLKLPNGVHPDDLFSLRAIRQCQSLEFWPLVDNHVLAGRYGPYAKFSAKAIINWLNATGGYMKLRGEHLWGTDFGNEFIQRVKQNFLTAGEPSKAELIFYRPDCGIDSIAEQHNPDYEQLLDKVLTNSIGEEMTVRMSVPQEKTHPLGEKADKTFNIFKTHTFRRRLLQEKSDE